MKEIEVYIASIKIKWPQYGYTIMCDGWSSRNRKPIVNFMIYCDRSMIYHTSVDTTNISKIANYIFSIMDKVVDKVGEEISCRFQSSWSHVDGEEKTFVLVSLCSILH